MVKIIHKKAMEEELKMDKEKKLKEKRKEIIQFLKDEKITAYDWEWMIVKYINQQYQESTLQ